MGQVVAVLLWQDFHVTIKGRLQIAVVWYKIKIFWWFSYSHRSHCVCKEIVPRLL